MMGSMTARRITSAAWGRTQEKAERMDKDSLYKMLWAGGVIGMKMSDVLELFKRERMRFRNSDLISCAKAFRDCGHFKHSVQLLEWIGKRTLDRSKGDSTVSLDIVYNLKGMTEAYKYFASLPPETKSLPTNGALLNYYSSRLVQLQQNRQLRSIRG